MLDTRFAKAPHAARPSRRRVRDALGWFVPKHRREHSRLATAPREELLRCDDHALPAIVIRAQEDARCRQALARLGFFRVRSAYARQKADGNDTFVGLDPEFLSPTMDFVRDWLREERKRIVARARWPFLMTMLATIVAGLAFLAVSAVLG